MSSHSTGTRPDRTSSSAVAAPTGYRRSEVGLIPNDWEPRSVGSVGEVLTGKALAVRGPGRQRPYLRTKNVFDGRIDLADVLSMPMTDRQFARYQIQHGDVLLNEGQSLELVGRCSMYSGEYCEPCAIQNQLLRFRARDEVSAEYAAHLFRYCQQTGVFARIALQTTSIAHLGVGRFQRLLLAWPEKKAEQDSIAAALSDVDALIGALEKLIAKKRFIKLAAMQQLLTGKTRLPGFGGDWVTRRVGDLLSFLATANNPRKDLSREGDLRYIHYGDVHAHATPVLDCTATDLPMIAGNKVGSATPLEDGDLVFVDASEDMVGVGKSVEVCNLTGVGVVAGLHTIACRGSDEDWAKGFKAYLQFIPAFKHALERVATGISVYAISKRQIAEVELPLPPATEQAVITLVLSDMDAEIVALERRRDKTKSIKQGMMQALLTGWVRLVKPDRGGEETT